MAYFENILFDISARKCLAHGSNVQYMWFVMNVNLYIYEYANILRMNHREREREREREGEGEGEGGRESSPECVIH